MGILPMLALDGPLHSRCSLALHVLRLSSGNTTINCQWLRRSLSLFNLDICIPQVDSVKDVKSPPYLNIDGPRPSVTYFRNDQSQLL
jgi:hypothetical protein